MRNPTPITDSPWFWLLMFSLFASLVLLLFGNRYSRRQSGIERKYQARERIDTGESSSGQKPLSSEDVTLIPLWPIGVVLLGIVVLAIAMLIRQKEFSKPTAKRS